MDLQNLIVGFDSRYRLQVFIYVITEYVVGFRDDALKYYSRSGTLCGLAPMAQLDKAYRFDR